MRALKMTMLAALAIGLIGCETYAEKREEGKERPLPSAEPEHNPASQTEEDCRRQGKDPAACSTPATPGR